MQTWKLFAASLVISQMPLADSASAASAGADGIDDSGWVLSALPDQAALAGQRATLLAQPRELSSGNRGATTPSPHELTATILDRPCSDRMSGMPHPNTVTVVVDGKTMTGCGGDPATLLQGEEWVVEDLDRTGIIDSSRATLHFAPDGRLAGRSFCNTYRGEYRLTGETLTLTIATMTRKFCPPALMQQEQRFVEVVRAVRRFSLSADGALVLEADHAGRILARRG